MKSLIMLAVLCLGFLSLGCYSQRIVQTRIVIEETMTDAGPVYFINPEQVYGDLRRAESIFKPANVKFRVTCIELKPRKTSIWCYVDAEMHWQLSVYYMDPTDLPLRYRGQTDVLGGGIIITPRSDGVTLAHEIGHWGGLFHAFGELDDMVKDTPFQRDPGCKQNCGNIMNYCDHGRYYLTPGQVLRWRKIVDLNRRSTFTQRGPDLLEPLIEVRKER